MALRRPAAPAPRSHHHVQQSTGAGEYTVKHKRATALQRRMIDGTLSQAKDDRASRRVMIAAIMCITQESGAGEEMQKTGNDDVGLYQQGRNWISAEGAKDPEKATHAFLITGPTSWKKTQGGVKKAPGDLNAALMRVQGSVGGYAQWEDEATKTVDTWLDNGGDSGGGSYAKRYTFTRGERGGQRENSWDAAARLVEEVGAYRWAADNVFFAVSGDELRRAGPALMIRGDEGWLRSQPQWSWSAGRVLSEITLDVLADFWDIEPGGVVTLHRRFGPMSGKWMVWNASGDSLTSPEAVIVLRRPTRLKAEPAHEVADRSDGGGGDKTVDKLRTEAKKISDHRSEYVYGASHGKPLKSLKSNSHMDCSSSVSLALARAGFLDLDKPARDSSGFANWGSEGKGDEFTVWWNASHVWIEFHDSGHEGDRFDTSQHSGKSGPMYTTKKRTDQGRFKARHAHGH